MIFYEAPHHLKKTLQELAAVLGDRKITLCRELTKRFETVMPTTIFAATDYFETNDPRGEYVLVIEGKSYEEKKQEHRKTGWKCRWRNMLHCMKARALTGRKP